MSAGHASHDRRECEGRARTAMGVWLGGVGSSCSALDGWRADSVTLDGVEVGARTAAIRFEGERPIGLVLWGVDERGMAGKLDAAGLSCVAEYCTGAIVVTGLRRL